MRKIRFLTQLSIFEIKSNLNQTNNNIVAAARTEFWYDYLLSTYDMEDTNDCH